MPIFEIRLPPRVDKLYPYRGYQDPPCRIYTVENQKMTKTEDRERTKKGHKLIQNCPKTDNEVTDNGVCSDDVELLLSLLCRTIIVAFLKLPGPSL
jgi:hypothetical protein